jgi:hypothetical protein
MTSQRIALTVIPTPIEATVRNRNPPIVGVPDGEFANHDRTSGENGLTPRSTVAPGNKYATSGPKLALVTLCMRWRQHYFK